MQYFFRKHEENFKEWRNAGYAGIPPLGAEFLKHLRSRHFKLAILPICRTTKLLEHIDNETIKGSI